MAVNYRDLTVYKKARDLAIGIDRLIKTFPRTSQATTIATQMFASAASIGANIAEGKGKNSGKEYLRYLTHAQGSANETDHWLHTALDCELASADKIEPLLALVLEILKILMAARTTLSRQAAAGPARAFRENSARYSIDSVHSDTPGAESVQSGERPEHITIDDLDWPITADWIDPLELDNP